MIGKRGKLLILIYMLFLLVLFLMCSTDLIIREPEKEIYQVAVIIEDARDDNYGNFRRGMDQAAVEFNADVRFITLYEELDSGQQMELISREQLDGADALIVAPVDEDMLAGAMTQKQVTIPVVLLGSELSGEGVIGNVFTDYKKMGEHLARQILAQTLTDSSVFLFAVAGSHGTMDSYFLEGAREALEDAGCPYQTVLRDGESGFLETMENLRFAAGMKAVIIAESPEILAEVAGIMAEDASYLECVQGLYGHGGTLPILNDLDRGLIKGICVTDGFSAGYFSVSMAVQKLEGLEIRTPLQMDYYYIEKEDLREPAYENLLFPIE